MFAIVISLFKMMPNATEIVISDRESNIDSCVQQRIDHIFRQLDVNMDNMISFDEFIKLGDSEPILQDVFKLI